MNNATCKNCHISQETAEDADYAVRCLITDTGEYLSHDFSPEVKDIEAPYHSLSKRMQSTIYENEVFLKSLLYKKETDEITKMLLEAETLRIEALLEIIKLQKEKISILRDIIDIKSGRKK